MEIFLFMVSRYAVCLYRGLLWVVFFGCFVVLGTNSCVAWLFREFLLDKDVEDGEGVDDEDDKVEESEELSLAISITFCSSVLCSCVLSVAVNEMLSIGAFGISSSSMALLSCFLVAQFLLDSAAPNACASVKCSVSCSFGWFFGVCPLSLVTDNALVALEWVS